MNIDSTNSFELVLQLAMGSTVVLAAGLAIILVLYRQSSATKHLAGTLTCIALLILPVAIVLLPSWRLGLVQLSSTQPTRSGSIVSQASAFPQAAFTATMLSDTATASESTSAPTEFRRDVVRSPESTKSLPLVVCFIGIYLLGVTYGLLRLVTDHVLAWRLTANSKAFTNHDLRIKTPRVHIRISDQVCVPMVTGILRPTVLLPSSASGWPADQMRSAIAHEMAHVERHDLAVQLMSKVVAIVYWPQPLVHLLVKIMRIDRETACDDRALASGQLRTEYARHLLDVASELSHRNRDRIGVLAMARSSNVESRINAVLSPTRRRSRPAKSVVVLMLFSMLASLFGSAWISPLTDNDSRVFAQEKTITTAALAVTKIENGPDDQAYRASGRVIDANGEPVVGALVVAPVYTDELELKTAIQTTNDDGAFELVYPANVRSFEMFHTWAYAEGHAIRVVMMKKAFGETRGAENVEIQLPGLDPVGYRILLPDGTACTDAIVGPDQISVPNGVFAADESTGLSRFVPDEIFDQVSRYPNENGEVTLDCIPTPLFDSISVTTSSYGKQRFARRENTLQLKPVGEIRGTVMVDSPERFAGTKVLIQTDGGSLQTMGSGQGIAQVELDATGRFHVPVIAAGFVSLIWLLWDDNASVQPVLEGRGVVTAGETLNLTIETRPAVTLNGQVHFEDTRQPVVGARIHMRNLKSPTRGSYEETDEQGRYSIRVPAGKIHRQVTSLGQNESARFYDFPRLSNMEVASDVESVELEPILFTPKTIVRGRLQDASAKPIGGVTVAFHSGSFGHLHGSAETDADGKFEMPVRNWKSRQKMSTVLDQSYWAVLEQPSVGASAPEYTRLKILNVSTDATVLEKPNASE